MVLGKGLNKDRGENLTSHLPLLTSRKEGYDMYFVFFSIVIGMIIGLFTNALAIKMLFHPFYPIKIGKRKLPFTPGLIPKRRDEIALKLGEMVEGYLFTAEGLQQFMDDFGLREQLFHRLTEKLKAYKKENNTTVGELLKRYVNDDWREQGKQLGKDKVFALLHHPKVKEATLERVLSEETLTIIEKQIEFLSEAFLYELTRYLHTIEGKRWLDTSLKQALEGKSMLGYFAGLLLEGEQIQQKLLDYLEQLLKQDTTKAALQKILLKEWEQIKRESLGVWLLKYNEVISKEVDNIVAKGIRTFDEMSMEQLISYLESNRFIEKIYSFFLDLIEKKLDKVFHYLSISDVVSEQVKGFSLEKLEKMLIEVAGRELKMITYFGGVLGGGIGFIQGMLYLIF